MKDPVPYQAARHVDLGYEVWARWDHEAEVYELFLEEECEAYIGFAETKQEAREAALAYFEELKAG